MLKTISKLIKQPQSLTILVFSFSIFVLFYNLGGHYLEDWDEAFYAVMARTAIQNGNYLFLEYQNDIHWSKTPFSLYPMMASFKLFGVSEATARLSSALFALGIIFQIFIITRRYYGQMTALLAVVITVTITQFVFHHGLKSANIDSITLFFLTGSLSCWLLIKNQDYRIILTFISLAFAFLCKGPIIAIPLIVIGLSFIVQNPIKRDSLKPLLIGIFVSAVIVLPWYIYAYKVYGDIFVQNHIIYNFLQRYTEGIEGHKYGAMYYMGYIFRTEFFIWIGATLFSIVYFFKMFSKEKRPIEFVLITWVFVTFIITHVSQTKLWWYIYPLYPPLAIMVAKTLTDFVKRPGILNGAAYYIGLMAILSSAFHHSLFVDKNVFRKSMTVLLATVLSIGGIGIYLNKYLSKYKESFRVLLILFLCIIPVYRTVKLTMHKNLNAPISFIAKSLDFSKPIYAFTINPDIFPPGAYYYLSEKGDVRLYHNITDIKFLKGKTVVVKTQILEKLQKNHNGTLHFSYEGVNLIITPVESQHEFTLVKVD
jgi:4-amino-4-deoxy-L-arabinose transferase-like glycosyltransferase